MWCGLCNAADGRMHLWPPGRPGNRLGQLSSRRRLLMQAAPEHPAAKLLVSVWISNSQEFTPWILCRMQQPGSLQASRGNSAQLSAVSSSALSPSSPSWRDCNSAIQREDGDGLSHIIPQWHLSNDLHEQWLPLRGESQWWWFLAPNSGFAEAPAQKITNGCSRKGFFRQLLAVVTLPLIVDSHVWVR